MNDFEKEVFTEEELSQMNEKLKKHENTELPESLNAENIEKQLKSDPHIWISNSVNEEKVKKQKRRLTLAASVAAVLVICLLSTAFFNRGQIMNYFLEKGNNSEKETQNIIVVDPDKEIAIPPSLVSDYGEIEAMFLAYAEKYDDNYYFYIEDGAIIEDDMELGEGAVNTPTARPESGDGYKGEYGETNEQVQGVSEADIIKNDGKYLYVIDPENTDWDSFYEEMSRNYNKDDREIPELQYTCSVSVIEADAEGNMNRVSKVFIEEDSDNVYHMLLTELYVLGDKMIVIADVRVYDEADEDAYNNIYYGGYRTTEKTMAVCFDIADRSAPVEMWRIYQDGSYISSRLIGDQLIMLSEYGVNLNDDDEEIVENCIPTIGYNAGECKRIACDCIVVMEEIYDTTYLVASTLDTDSKDTLKTQAVLGAGDNVYCTTETLYATSNDYSTFYSTGDLAIEIFGYDTINTQIYKFDIRNYDIVYMGDTAIPGTALNQFSMDEYNGYLRIATTSGSWGDSLTNQLYVLDENLQTVGKIEGIAQGESIQSVRFSGDTGYIVTFEQTDPLFVVDLSDPANPVIKGELKIPGFSSYLHPVGDGLVLGIGFDGTESGTNGGLKISLFDVSDPENPVECDKIVVSVDNDYDETWSYINCDAWYNHKAICWDGTNKIMYVPFNYNQSIYLSDYTLNYYTGHVLAVRIDTENKKLVNEADYTYVLSQKDYVSGFNRVTYIGDAIYALTDFPRALYSFNKTTAEYNNTLDLR